jgi:cytochrome P450
MQRPVEFPEIDLCDVDAFGDGRPQDWFTTLRDQAPIWWQDEPNGPGFWNITKYEDLKFASKTPKLFSSWTGGTNMFELSPVDLESVRLMMINMDPPQHAKFRRLVSRGFTPKRIAMLEAHTRELAKKIVDDVADRGECEFVDDVDARLPMDDLASILVNGKLDGERLSPLEFDSFFLILAIAGNETTRTVTAQGMRLLMEHPEQRERLRADPSLPPGAVEEILRYNPPVMHFRRTMTEDFEMRGQTLRAGDKVVLWYPSANRDEDVYGDGQVFDIERSPNEHLAFGVGEHFCLGANLARLQLNSIFNELVARLGNAQPAGPIRRLRSNFIDGIKEMPVTFTPESK